MAKTQAARKAMKYFRKLKRRYSLLKALANMKNKFHGKEVY
jgi:hypothetical protein